MRTIIVFLAVVISACVGEEPCELTQLDDNCLRVPIQIVNDPTDSTAKQIVDESIDLLNTASTVAVAAVDNDPDVVVTIVGMSVLGTSDVRVSYDVTDDTTKRLSIQLHEEIAEDRPTAVSIVVRMVARHLFGYEVSDTTPECIGYMTEQLCTE